MLLEELPTWMLSVVNDWLLSSRDFGSVGVRWHICSVMLLSACCEAETKVFVDSVHMAVFVLGPGVQLVELDLCLFIQCVLAKLCIP